MEENTNSNILVGRTGLARAIVLARFLSTGVLSQEERKIINLT